MPADKSWNGSERKPIRHRDIPEDDFGVVCARTSLLSIPDAEENLDDLDVDRSPPALIIGLSGVSYLRISMAANIQSLLEKVRSDRAALKPEIERLQAEDLRLQHVEDYLLKEIDAGLALHLPSIAHVNGVEPNGSTATAGRSIVLDNMMRHEACEAILKESGLPMRTVDMAERLQAKGYQKAMKPEMLSSALFTAMLRKPETFKKVGRGLWGLANKTY